MGLKEGQKQMGWRAHPDASGSQWVNGPAGVLAWGPWGGLGGQGTQVRGHPGERAPRQEGPVKGPKGWPLGSGAGPPPLSLRGRKLHCGLSLVISLEHGLLSYLYLLIQRLQLGLKYTQKRPHTPPPKEACFRAAVQKAHTQGLASPRFLILEPASNRPSPRGSQPLRLGALGAAGLTCERGLCPGKAAVCSPLQGPPRALLRGARPVYWVTRRSF